MNRIKHAFLQVLQNNLKHDGKNVPVLVRDYPLDNTPCITLSSQEGIEKERVIENKLHSLNENHPLFDPENPEKKYSQEIFYFLKLGSVIINIWTNDKNQKKSLIDQVKNLLYKAMFYNYQFCIQYNTETKICKTTGEKCDVLTMFNGRTVKERCPFPKERKHEGLLYFHGAKPGSIKLRPEFDLDELDKKPPLLRTILKIDLKYYEEFNAGGNPINSISVDLDTEIK